MDVACPALEGNQVDGELPLPPTLEVENLDGDQVLPKGNRTELMRSPPEHGAPPFQVNGIEEVTHAAPAETHFSQNEGTNFSQEEESTKLSPSASHTQQGDNTRQEKHFPPPSILPSEEGQKIQPSMEDLLHAPVSTHDQSHTSLKLSVLKRDMKIKSHVKPRGRPKHTGTLWPSRSMKRKQQEKENTPAAKRTCSQKTCERPVVHKRLKNGPGTPAYRLKKGREYKRKPLTSKAEDVIGVDLLGVSTSSSESSPEFVVNGQKILKEDLCILESVGKWLNERLINAGLRMLREEFPKTAGLYDVCLSDSLAYPLEERSEFVQILNVSNSHWICASTKGCRPGAVNVFDSMRTGDVPFATKEVIAALINSDRKKIHMLFPDVQQQPDAASCGLFALANAYSLCGGKEPAKVHYDYSQMRNHFLSCLLQKKFTTFPSKAVVYNPGKQFLTGFNIYCSCRLPDNGDKMVRCDHCKEWYHFTCVGLDPSYEVKNTSWLCTKCS